MTSFEISKQRGIPGHHKLIPCTFHGDLQRNPSETLVNVNRCSNENHLMTHCFGWPESPKNFVRFAENLWEEFVFEVLLGLDFSLQPNTGL